MKKALAAALQRHLNLRYITLAGERNKPMSDIKDKTLCALQGEGYIETNTEEFIKMLDNLKCIA